MESLFEEFFSQNVVVEKVTTEYRLPDEDPADTLSDLYIEDYCKRQRKIYESIGQGHTDISKQAQENYTLLTQEGFVPDVSSDIMQMIVDEPTDSTHQDYTRKTYTSHSKAVIKASKRTIQAGMQATLLLDALTVEPRFGHLLPTVEQAFDLENETWAIGVGTQNLIGYYTNKIKVTTEIADKTGNKVIKLITKSNFRLEDEHFFPLSFIRYPHVIERIEHYLHCTDKLMFRASFSNVSQNANGQNCIPRAVHELRDPSIWLGLERVRGPQHCICKTEFFQNINAVRKFAPTMRAIYSHHITLLPV